MARCAGPMVAAAILCTFALRAWDTPPLASKSPSICVASMLSAVAWCAVCGAIPDLILSSHGEHDVAALKTTVRRIVTSATAAAGFFVPVCVWAWACPRYESVVSARAVAAATGAVQIPRHLGHKPGSTDAADVASDDSAWHGTEGVSTTQDSSGSRMPRNKRESARQGFPAPVTAHTTTIEAAACDMLRAIASKPPKDATAI